MALRVCTAYNPRDRGSSPGHDHYVTDTVLKVGRILRKRNSVLCRPDRNFWGLYDSDKPVASCPRCLEIASRLPPELAKVEVPGPQKKVKLAGECPPCPCCGEPWCTDCQKHYAECACPGPHSEEDAQSSAPAEPEPEPGQKECPKVALAKRRLTGMFRMILEAEVRNHKGCPQCANLP